MMPSPFDRFNSVLVKLIVQEVDELGRKLFGCLVSQQMNNRKRRRDGYLNNGMIDQTLRW